MYWNEVGVSFLSYQPEVSTTYETGQGTIIRWRRSEDYIVAQMISARLADVASENSALSASLIEDCCGPTVTFDASAFVVSTGDAQPLAKLN